METINLTKWLDMVWKALNEQDEVKRDRLLHAAEIFLQEENQEFDPARPSAQRRKMAA